MSSGETAERFKIVILYDRFTSVGRAMEAFGHLERELQNDFIPELCIWRIDVATLPECAAQADADFKTAEIIILAVHGSHHSHGPFLRRIERAGGGPSPPKRALIAIIEAANEFVQSAGTWDRVLGSDAAETPPDVFLWATPKSAEFSEAAPESCLARR
jgi:hypothetical protein